MDKMNIDELVKLINTTIPNENIQTNDVKLILEADTNADRNTIIFKLLFGCVFTLFGAILLNIVIEKEQKEIAFIIFCMVFLIVGITILLMLIVDILSKPYFIFTASKIYKILSNKIEAYELSKLIKDVLLTKNLVYFKVLSKDKQDFTPMFIHTKEYGNQILEYLYNYFLDNDRYTIVDIRKNVKNSMISKYIIPPISYIGMLLIGSWWCLLSLIFVFGGFTAYWETKESTTLILGVLGSVFFLSGLYFFLYLGIISLLKTGYLYEFTDEGIVITREDMLRYIDWREVSFYKYIKKNHALIEASLQHVSLRHGTECIPDELHIYSKDKLEALKHLIAVNSTKN